jgi:hypothetical protein
MANIRETVLNWDPFTEPTITQYNAAIFWLEVSKNKPAVTAFDRAKIKELIRRFEYNHPEIFPR